MHDLAPKLAKIECKWRKDCGEAHTHELLSRLHQKIARKMQRGSFQVKYLNVYAKDVWKSYWKGNHCGIVGAPKSLERRTFNERRHRITPSAVRAIDERDAREAAASPEWAHFEYWIYLDNTYSQYLVRYGFTNTRKGREAFHSMKHARDARYDRGDACKIEYVGVVLAPGGYTPYIRDVDRVFFPFVFDTQLEAAEFIEGGREECGLPPLNYIPFDFSWAN